MPHDKNQDLSELHDWLASAAPSLGVDPAEVPVDAVLDLATAVAHGVLRPGVPVTAFLAGLAIGRGTTDAVSQLTARAQAWRTGPDSGSPREAR